MRLLVSVASALETAAALEGAADFIDAKNPFTGAIAPVAPDVLREIRTRVAGARPITAALGDACDEESIARTAREYADAGAELVKVGLAGTTNARHAVDLISAAARGAAAGGASVVVVAYADFERASCLAPAVLTQAAANAGGKGLLIDTFDKRGLALPRIIDRLNLTQIVATAHRAGLFVALAGKLTVQDLPLVHTSGADIVGFRGAACEGGRIGRVCAERVRAIRDAIDAITCDEPTLISS
jgi:(5-formylfuran-3-yl)methyl phosphate synthase